MADLSNLKKGQTITEHIDTINDNVNLVNNELVGFKDNIKNVVEDNSLVKSVQWKTGNVILTASEIGAFPNSASIQELDINNIKDTGVYIGTNANNPYYLIVIKYNDTNIYQELIGLNTKKYRRFTGVWSEWVIGYSNENPVTARDVTGIHQISEDKYMEVAILNDGTFVTTELKVNPVTNTLSLSGKTMATTEYVDNAVNMIKSVIVNELPETAVENTIYFVPNTKEDDSNEFIEWIWVNGAWEIVGGTSIDLTPFLPRQEASEIYATKSENDAKVSKTTTINNKALTGNITLNAEDVGALPIGTKLETNAVNKYTNEEIETKLSNGEFVNGNTFIVLDEGDYLKGHIYTYNNELVDITDMITDYVDLSTNQSIGGVKNFTGILRLLGEDVATEKYVDENGGKIDVIAVNGVNQSIDGKRVNIAVPTTLDEIANEDDKKVLGSGINSSKVLQIQTNADDIADLQKDKVDKSTLNNYTLSVDEASKVSLDINTSTYVMTLKLLNSKDETLSSDTIDLPLETMVVDASYNSTTKEIVLTLKNGTSTKFSVADLVSGLASQSDLDKKANISDLGYLAYLDSLTASDVGALPSDTTIPSIEGLAKQSDVDGLTTRVGNLESGKVDKINGKGLSTNDYTTAEKNKLAGLSNYDDSVITEDITNLENNKVDKVTGKALSTNDFTNAYKTKLDGLSNYDDTKVKSDISSLSTNKADKSSVTAIDGRVTTIEGKIPTLASQDFVNSSIATATSTFRGTYSQFADLPKTNVDLNDYAFVSTTDSIGNKLYKRYKYVDGAWVFEYDLNNSSFTAQQWATINSGVTASDRQSFVNNITKTTEIENDLKTRPTMNDIPDVNDGALVIKVNGAVEGRFTANQSGDTTIDISVPTGTAASKGYTTSITGSSNLPTDSAVKSFVEGKKYITSSASITGNAATATKATGDGNGNNIVNTYATKSALTSVENKIPSITGLATETFVKENQTIKELTGTSSNPIVLWNLDAGFYVLKGYVKISTASRATTYTIQAVRSSAASETSTDGILTYVTTKYGTTNRGVTFYDAEYTSSGLLMTFGGHLGERGVLKCLITSTTTAFTTSNAKKFGWPTNAFTNVTFSNNKLSFSQLSGGSKIIENIATLDDLANAGGITFEQSAVVEPQINELLEKIYPIGSIYMSVNNVSPASFLGGTWERIQDRFLLGAGSSYSAGTTGGEATHTLTINEMPTHGHTQRANHDSDQITSADRGYGRGGGWSVKLDAYGTNYYQGTANTGGGQAHNNMPPYLAVYIFKRIA